MFAPFYWIIVFRAMFFFLIIPKFVYLNIVAFANNCHVYVLLLHVGVRDIRFYLYSRLDTSWIWFPLNKLSSPYANHLNCIHKVRDYERKAKFDFWGFSPWWSYASVHFSWKRGHPCPLETFFHFSIVEHTCDVTEHISHFYQIFSLVLSFYYSFRMTVISLIMLTVVLPRMPLQNLIMRFTIQWGIWYYLARGDMYL